MISRRLLSVLLALLVPMMLVGAQSATAATITVDTTADDFGSDLSHCSVRDAMKSVDGVNGGALSGTDFGGCVASGAYAFANLGDPPDTIMLPNLGGPYQLTLSGSPEDNDASGDLDVFRAMNIVGTGNPTIQQTVSGARVIDTTATGKKLSLSDLTMTGGDQGPNGNGGGIQYVGGAGAAQLTLDGVTVTGNQTGIGNGGGIFTDSPTTITNSVISNNKTLTPSGVNGNGGGIYQDGFASSFTGVSLTVDKSQITGNFAGDATNVGSGGGIWRMTKAADGTSSALIQDSDISGNTAHSFGGGIDTHSDATLDINRSLIGNNHAVSPTTGRGGGIEADPTISSNLGTLNVVNTTVTGNSAVADGGGIHVGNDGAANLSLLFSTIAQNTGTPGSELAFSGLTTPKPNYTVEGSAFVATDPALMNACNIAGANFANRTDDGYNVSTDPTDATGPNAAGPGCGIFAVQPGDHTLASASQLGALTDNGEPTKTMEPLPSSVLLDNMANSVCTAITPAVNTDQRGYPRPDASGANCDTGAYEAFVCNGVVQNTPGPFSACVPPVSTPGGGGTSNPPSSTPVSPPPTKKKCKKHKHRASAAKKCKKRK